MRKRVLAHSQLMWPTAALGLLLARSILGYQGSSLTGIVTTKGGEPISGVTVYGSKYCCPFKGEETTTDKNGLFRLEHPGAVIHFQKTAFQPLVLVPSQGTSQVHVTLEQPSGGLVVPTCGDPTRGQKRIGWGKYGIQYDVPKRGLAIQGGKPDVDYVEYVIHANNSKSHLELWFGPYAMNPDPDDEEFINSVDFKQRNVVFPDGTVIGRDSRGRSGGGEAWRQTTVGLEGARYWSKHPEDATLFDRVVDSICTVPYPKQ